MNAELSEAIRKCPVVKALYDVGETPEGIILILVRLKEQMSQEIADLKLMAPKRVKMSDGSMRIWRCPEELIPEEAFSPMEIGEGVLETETNREQGVNNLC